MHLGIFCGYTHLPLASPPFLATSGHAIHNELFLLITILVHCALKHKYV